MHSSENKALLEQLSRFKANGLIQQCIVAIEDLELQLQRQIKINQQQKHLISILQQGKEYYQNEFKSNMFQKEYSNLKAEFNRVNLLAKEYKQANQELRQKFADLSQQLQEKNRQAQSYQQSLYQLKLQKELLQKQWNRAVKAVKKKILIITKGKESINPERNKQNIDQQCRQTGKGYSKDNGKMDLISRAQMMIKQIQKEEAIQKLQGIFLNSSIKKPKENNQQNKERMALRELSQNNLFDHL